VTATTVVVSTLLVTAIAMGLLASGGKPGPTIGVVSGLFVGVLGMAVPNGERGVLERLAEKIERAQAGEDVSFETDRDDEIGRLATAIDGLVSGHEDEQADELAVLDRTTEAFFAVDEDWRFTFLNERGREIVREAMPADKCAEIDDLEGVKLWEAVPSVVDTIFYDRGQEAMETREPIRFEADYEPLDTRFEVRVYPSASGLSVYVRDLTDNTVSERELDVLRERMEFALEVTDSLIFEADIETGEETRYGPFEELYGIPEEKARTTEEFYEHCIHPEDRARIEQIQQEELGTTSNSIGYEYRTNPEYGNMRWMRGKVYLNDARGESGKMIGLSTDVTDRKEHERELERTKELLGHAGRVARVGAWEVDARGDTLEQIWSDEVYDIHELPHDETVSPSEGIEFYHPEDRPRVRELFERALEGEEYDIEARLLTDEGTVRWVQSIGVPVREDGDVVGVRGSIQDITDQKERELALESLHEASRRLLGTETRADAAELVVSTGSSVLDVAGVGLYLLDPESSTLDAVACTPTFKHETGGALPVSASVDSPVWDCFVTEQTRVIDAETDAHSVLFGPDTRERLLVPVGDHGVFVIMTDSPVEESTRQFAETLVATAEAAFDRIESEVTLKERDAELDTRTRELRQQIQITDTIRRVDRSLVGATNREEMERAVCEGLIEGESIVFAWIGDVSAGRDVVEPRVWAGAGDGYLDAVSLATDENTREPAIVAMDTGDPTLVSSIVDSLTGEPWRKLALEYDFHSVVSVPVVYEDYTYGVLAVYADEPDAFGDRERSVFEELGQNIAHSIDAIEARQALRAQTLVELTLELDPTEAVLGRVARAAGCRIEFEGLAATSDQEVRLFVHTDADPTAVTSVFEEFVDVREYRLVDDTDAGALFKITVAGDTLVSQMLHRGATPQSIRVSDGRMAVVVDVPTATDVRAFVEMVRETVPEVELVGRRRIERETTTGPDRSVLAGLTDRQHEVLRTAYHAGFFEWPRTSTGEEVAEMLGLSQPTVNRHLRLGQQHISATLFDRDRTDTETPTDE